MSKVSRRTAIKVLGIAGAALAAAPYLAKASAFQQLPGSEKNGAASEVMRPTAQQSYDAPLVLVVKGDQIMAYRGLNQMPVQDSSLAGMLNDRFGAVEAGN